MHAHPPIAWGWQSRQPAALSFAPIQRTGSHLSATTTRPLLRILRSCPCSRSRWHRHRDAAAAAAALLLLLSLLLPPLAHRLRLRGLLLPAVHRRGLPCYVQSTD